MPIQPEIESKMDTVEEISSNTIKPFDPKN
jgi:hypothetical protein